MADHGGGKGARKVVWDSFWASRGWKPQISAREPANPARRPVNCPAAAESACLPNAKLQLARQVQSQSSAKTKRQVEYMDKWPAESGPATAIQDLTPFGGAWPESVLATRLRA